MGLGLGRSNEWQFIYDNAWCSRLAFHHNSSKGGGEWEKECVVGVHAALGS